LVGTWEGIDEQKNRIWARFEPGKNHGLNLAWSGLGGANPEFRVTTTKVSGSDYMMLRLSDPNNDKDYIVGRYSVDDSKLTICLLNGDKIKQSIKDGKLKGQISNSQWGGVVITENSTGVFNFLRSPETANLFSCIPELKKATSGP
jgi:hypothetical protein